MQPRLRYFSALVLLLTASLTFLSQSSASAWWLSTSVLQSPTGGVRFGSANITNSITVLPNGNYVVVDWAAKSSTNSNVGAVHLFDGTTHTLISSLTGTQADDQVGSVSILVLRNSSNFVVLSKSWANGSTLRVGAVTWCNGTTGCNGPVSASNSLIGSFKDAQVGNSNIVALANGNYVVGSPSWNDGTTLSLGAAILCNGATGCTGTITASNSLYGTSADDKVGSKITALSDGNYVVTTSDWDNGALTNAGAVTWCSGTTGCTGPVTTSNSLYGTTANDQVGSALTTALTGSGGYVVSSPNWDNGATTNVGAATLCTTPNGCTGPVTTSNSLHGTQTSDGVGTGATSLADGDYVVRSPDWDNGSTSGVGAVTWCSGTTGCTGPVTTSNSLYGTTTTDNIGNNAPFALSNGDYLLRSTNWDNGSTADVGAVTLCNGTTGCTGPVTTSNSLHGTTTSDKVGSSTFAELSDGDYVVRSPNWDNGSTVDVGAVTWCSGTTGCTGPVTTSNSLHGTTASDQVGSSSVTALTANGHYVVTSPNWDNGALSNVGAITWCNGTTGCTGTVSASNSLYGTTANDSVGNGATIPIPDGNYLVANSHWYSATSQQTGGVVWGNGSTAGPRTVGALSSANTVPGLGTSKRVGQYQHAFDSARNKLLVSNFLISDEILVISLGTQNNPPPDNNNGNSGNSNTPTPDTPATDSPTSNSPTSDSTQTNTPTANTPVSGTPTTNTSAGESSLDSSRNSSSGSASSVTENEKSTSSHKKTTSENTASAATKLPNTGGSHSSLSVIGILILLAGLGTISIRKNSHL